MPAAQRSALTACFSFLSPLSAELRLDPSRGRDTASPHRGLVRSDRCSRPFFRAVVPMANATLAGSTAIGPGTGPQSSQHARLCLHRACRLRLLVDSEADAAATQPAVPTRILVQILLVIVLGVVVLRRVLDLGRNRSVARLLQALTVALQTRLRGRALFG